MAFASIQQLKTALTGRGARANLFEINIPFPSEINSADLPSDATGTTKVLCKAAAVPGFTIGTIEVPFRAGRRIKIPGDRTFADWVNLISKGNYDSTTKSSSVVDYYKNITCVHLKADNSISRQYQLNDCFVTDVSAVDLSFDSTDTLSEFTVNFQYHYLKAGNATATFGALDDLSLST
jgi:hypothetical protein